MANRKKLGEILIEQGAATLDALKRGLSLQRKRGGRLGRTLVESKAISEAQLARALAAQSRMPLAKMKEEISASITDLVPLDLCQKHQAIAFGVRTVGDLKTIYVALADPYDDAAMDAIRSGVSGGVKFALAPASEIARAVIRADAGRDSAPSHPPAQLAPLPLPLPATAAPTHVPLPAPVPQRVPPPVQEAPAILSIAPARDEGGADLDALLGLGSSSPPPPTPPALASAVEVLDDLFDGGAGSGAPPPPPVQGLTFETDADVFDLSSQAEAVAAYSAQVAAAAEAPSHGQPQHGFLLGEALLDAGPASAPLSLEMGPQPEGSGGSELPDAVLPGIELTPEEIAHEAAGEWPPEASPWMEEPSSAQSAFDSPVGLAAAPSGADAPAFAGLSPVEDQDPFSEPTRQFDMTMLTAQLGGAGSAAQQASAVAPPAPDPAHADSGFDLFVAEEAQAEAPGDGGALEPFGLTPLPFTAFEEPGAEQGWHSEGEAEQPLGPIPRAEAAASSVSPARPASPAPVPPPAPPVTLPDLESLRAELSAYSSEHGAARALGVDIEGLQVEMAEGSPSALGPLGALGLEVDKAPASAIAFTSDVLPRDARPRVDSPSSLESPPRSTALPPPPDLQRVSPAFVQVPSPPEPAAGVSPAPSGALGEPVEISSDEIIDIEPDVPGEAPSPEPAPEAQGGAAPEARLFDEASLAAFSPSLGAPEAAPMSSGLEDFGRQGHAGEEAALPVLPRSTGPSLVSSFPQASAPQSSGEVLENLRRIASSDPLAPGMMSYAPDQLGQALAKLLSARGVISGGDLAGILEAPPEKLSLHLVRTLLAQAMLAPEDLVSMLTTPQERLNAAVLARLLERGAVAADELLGAL